MHILTYLALAYAKGRLNKIAQTAVHP